MPLKHPDPFVSRAERLDERVNPYVALLRESAASGELPLAFGAQLAEFPGLWRERLAAFHGRPSQPAQLVLEIGCHKGLTLGMMAEAYPDVGFLGLDITYKRVVTTAQRAKAKGHTNVFCAMANAQGLDRLFAPGELDGVVVFFPDPWIKKARQAKNRLVNEAFAARLATVLKPGGFFWLKTDQEVYFQEAAAALDATPGLRRAALTDGLLTRDFTSAFERRFQAQNLPTHAGKWLKSSETATQFA